MSSNTSAGKKGFTVSKTVHIVKTDTVENRLPVADTVELPIKRADIEQTSHRSRLERSEAKAGRSNCDDGAHR